MFFMAKSSDFQKLQKGLFAPIYQLFINKFNPKGSSGGKMGDWGLFFRSPIYIYIIIHSYILIKIIPHSPQKSPKALTTLTFLWGIFLKMPRKKPPKSPHRGQKSPTGQKKYPARLAEPYGAGLVFISTNILLRGLYLRFQSRGLEI